MFPSRSPSHCACLLWLAAIGIVGCNSHRESNSNSQPEPIHVVATVGMVADLVRAVGGEQVQVRQLMQAGVDPHLYKPTRDDVQLIQTGDIVFYSGLLLEGKMVHVLETVAHHRPVVAITQKLDRKLLLSGEDTGGHFDPHVWMDVATWSTCIDVIVKTLSEADPPHAEQYQERGLRYQAELARLDEYGRKSIASIPRDSRVLVTSHDAFGYFGRAYDIEVQGVQGLSTDSEAGLQRVNQLVDLLVARKVRAVFVESSVPRKSINAIIEGAAARGQSIIVGGELYSDAMGSDGTYEGTYIGMLDHNFTTATTALGGQAPAGGLNAKLTSSPHGP